MSRKKLWFVVILVLGIGVLSTGVFAQATQVDPFSTDLIVGGGNPASAMDIGDVQVWNDAESLYIRYVITDPSWCIVETHLQTATSLQDIPQRKGNPIPGQFEENDIHECVAQVLYTYNLAEKGWSLDDLLYIASHAAVMDNLGNIDTAWGAGFDFLGKNWATYFTYVVEGEIPVMWPDGGTITIAFEDLPLNEQFDYDYNDWVVDIDTLLTFWGTSSNRELQSAEFTFRPEARGAGYDHIFNMFFPGGTFGCDGVSTLRIFDGEGNLVSESIEDFIASANSNFEIIPWTRDALPEDYVFSTNTIEGMPYVNPQRTVYLGIAFNELCSFDFSGFDLTNPENVHGEGLFFDPWLKVVDTNDEVHQSDSRMLAVPVDWLWPEELTPIWLAYPDVVPGDPPNFTELWYLNFNDLVYNAEVGGAISGQVTEQGTGLPVAEIWVDSCYETVPEEEWGTWPQCQGAFTDETGYYSIPYLRPGFHRVVIWGDDVYISQFYHGVSSYDEAQLVEVFSDQNTGNIDFSLVRGGAISGIVTAIGGGLIEDNIDVSACLEDDSFCGWTSVQSDGTYEITGLRAGDYRVHAYQYPEEGYWIGEVYDNTQDWDAYTPVPVTAGEETSGINFMLEYGGAITGVIENEDGDRLADISVEACPFDDEDGQCYYSGTDADGSYTIFGVPEGEYRVHTGWQSHWLEEYYDDTPYWEEADQVFVEVGKDTSGIDFMLTLGGSFSGVIEDEAGDPLADVSVEACPYYEEEGQCYYWGTDEDGSYTIFGVPVGEYRVHTGWQSHWLEEYYDNKPYWEEADQVVVEAGKDTSGIDFTLTLGGSISGVIENEDGDRLADVNVEACPYYEEEGQCYYLGTDEDGNYTIFGVPVGTYRVYAGWNVNWLAEFFDDQYDWNLANPVVVNEGTDTPGINFTLALGGSISGTVYEANSDPLSTIAGVHVDACSSDDNFCNGTETNQYGEYTITGLLPDKTYTVFIWGQPSWANEIYKETIWWDQATPVPVGATGIDFTLDPGGSISGIVTDVNGKPLANIGVDIMNGGYGACTDENGYYSIMGLPYGTYDIVAGRDFCEPHPYIEQVITGVETTETTPNVGGIDFALELGGSISGVVTDESGNLIPESIDISVCLYDDDSICWWTTVSSNGSYIIGDLPADSYRVHAYQWPPGSWLDEFFEETRDWSEATSVTVTEGVDTPNIHFTLEEAIP